MISAILSSFNEGDNPIFWSNLALLNGRARILVVDGGSDDGTLERLKRLNIPVLVLPGSNRAQRYNHGISQAQGRLVLLVHPRTALSAGALSELEELRGEKLWGAFKHSFDHDHPLLRFTSWYSNYGRGEWRSIFYLDHCLFFTQDLREHARFPEVQLFEDTYFCTNLRKVAKGSLLKSAVVTSAVRFKRNGIFRQAAMNQLLKIMFLLGASEARMAEVYERGLGLNNK